MLSHQVIIIPNSHRDVWENRKVENANRLIKQVKLCLINTHKVDWSSKARNSIKLRTYIKFKFDHSLEEYLFYIPDTIRWIKALSRLIMSSHMLEIEWERHVKPQKIPLEQRIYQRCTSNSVDNEIHFLITCSYFATQRTNLLAKNKLHNTEFDSLSNNDKFKYIMSSTHRPLVICLAKYTYTVHLFWNLKHTTYRLIINGCYYVRYIVIWNNYKSPVSISSLFHDLT